MNCPLGYYLNGSSCEACAVDHYQDQEAQTSCIACTSGKSTSGKQASKRLQDCQGKKSILWLFLSQYTSLQFFLIGRFIYLIVRLQFDQYSCVSFIVQILKPGHLKEDHPVTTYSENNRFSIFFWKRTKKIQSSTVQALKTFKPLNLPDFLGNIPQINEYYWSVCVVRLHKNLRNFCFQKVFPVISIYIY